MLLVRGVALALALVTGCGSRGSERTRAEGMTEAVPGEAPPELAVEAIAEPTIDELAPDGPEEATVAIIEPPVIEPAVSTGPPVVLASGLRVRAGRVPVITLPSAEATRDLRDMLASFASGSRCEVLLATPTLVSVRCGDGGRGSYHPRSVVFVIDAFGAHPVPLLDLFRGGTTRELLEAPSETLPAADDDTDSIWYAADVALTERGLETAVLLRDDYFGRVSRRDYVFRTVGYRGIAPRIRADRALGALLSEHGLDVWPQPSEEMPPGGPEVGLRSTLRVRLGTVPTVVLTDAHHTETLHDLMVRYARGREDCSVSLAVSSFVSMQCFIRDSGREGVQSLRAEVSYFDIDESGEPHHVEQDEFFHVGMAPRGEIGAWGVEHGDGWTTYRSLAPAVRAESALGRALIERGLDLAPVGHRAPVVVHVVEHGNLARIADRARTRDELPRRVSAASVDEAWMVSPGPGDGEAMMAEELPPSTAVLELACATDSVLLRDAPDAASPVTAEILSGSEVVVARGEIGAQLSAFGDGRWIYVAGNPGGWASGGQLLPSYCTVVSDDDTGE